MFFSRPSNFLRFFVLYNLRCKCSKKRQNFENPRLSRSENTVFVILLPLIILHFSRRAIFRRPVPTGKVFPTPQIPFGKSVPHCSGNNIGKIPPFYKNRISPRRTIPILLPLRRQISIKKGRKIFFEMVIFRLKIDPPRSI